MKMFFAAAVACAAFFVVAVVANRSASADDSMTSGAAPTSGYTLHIDADKHYSAHPDEIIHHWCKNFADGSYECQLYDGDGPDGRLVGVETIISEATYDGLSPAEQKLWHYHRTEIPKLHATMPGLTKEQADKVVAALLPTYGKVWILWDPMTSKNPEGQPSITVLK